MSNIYSQFYGVYRAKPIITLRFILFTALILVSFNGILQGSPPKIFIFLLAWLLIAEVFYHFKILRFVPKLTVSEASNPIDAFTLESLYCLSSNSQALIKKLLSFGSVNFLLQKANISPSELRTIQIGEEELIKHSVEIAKVAGGKYVTTMDIITAYLLLSEQEAKLLFEKKLRQEEILEILYWARSVYKTEETKDPIRVNFAQEGIGEMLQEGWTYETKKYMQELAVMDFKKPSQIVGRDVEYREITEALYQKKGVLLVGEPGCGRTAVLDKLSLDSFSGNVKGAFHKRFFEVLLDTILAGAENSGEIALRLENIIQEVSHSGNVILVVKNFENIAGASTFKVNLLDIIIPYVKSGKVQVVGLITPAAYKKYVEPFKELLIMFAEIDFPVLDDKTNLYVLFSKTVFLEEKYKVKVTYKALKACVRYARNYMPQVQLPGVAVSLLGDAIASLSKKSILEEEDVIKKVEEKSHIPIAAPAEPEKQSLLAMEQQLHKRVISQQEAVSAVSGALRRIRTGMVNRNKPISFLFLGPTGVGKTETAKSLAKVYFGSEQNLIRLDMSEYSGADGLARLLGIGDQKGELSEKVFDNPFTLLLLDEFEKASPAVLNLFLQILDDGRLTDNFGKTVSFVNVFIIATSNAGSEFVREEVGKGIIVDRQFRNKLLEFLQTKGIFSPELINRFDEIVVFKPLNREEIKEVAKILLMDFTKRMEEQDMKVSFDDKILDKIVSEGFDEQFGARPIRRYIQDNIENLISKKILTSEIGRGSSIIVSVDSSNNVSVG